MQQQKPIQSIEERLLERLQQTRPKPNDALDPVLAEMEPATALRLLSGALLTDFLSQFEWRSWLGFLFTVNFLAIKTGSIVCQIVLFITLGLMVYRAILCVHRVRQRMNLKAHVFLLLPTLGTESLALLLRLAGLEIWSANERERLLEVLTRLLARSGYAELRTALTMENRIFLRNQLSRQGNFEPRVNSVWEAFAAAALIALFEIHDAETRAIAKRWARQKSFPTPRLCEVARECLRTRGDAIL